MQLSSIAAEVPGVLAARHLERNPAITSIEYDSRRVGPGSLFVAMRGGSTDGSRFLGAALAAGAAAIVTDSPQAFATLEDTPALLVSHGRAALAALAAAFHGHPERHLAVTGITGTNGKTTTAFLTEFLLRHAGRTTAMVGTVEYRVGGRVLPAPHTTPEPGDLFPLMAEAVAAGATELVMEVSSHALEQRRVAGLVFDVAVFTNLTRDHLDYHGTMERYQAAKRLLFAGTLYPAPRVAVVNAEDAAGADMAAAAQRAGSEVWSYAQGADQGSRADFRAGSRTDLQADSHSRARTGSHPESRPGLHPDLRAEVLGMGPAGMRLALATPAGRFEVATRLTGGVNVSNLLAATGAALARGLGPAQIAAACRDFPPVPGRFESIDCGQPFTVIVDYAHTDDALRNLAAQARSFAGPGGRVILLFGCGGDRDRSKRTPMGTAAGEGSDLAVVTSDNPRGEDPQAILADILPGLRATGTPFRVEPDRARAIALALSLAAPGDIVLLAGKGHEKTQTVAGQVLPFDDAEVAARILAEKGYDRRRR